MLRKNFAPLAIVAVLSAMAAVQACTSDDDPSAFEVDDHACWIDWCTGTVGQSECYYGLATDYRGQLPPYDWGSINMNAANTCGTYKVPADTEMNNSFCYGYSPSRNEIYGRFGVRHCAN